MPAHTAAIQGRTVRLLFLTQVIGGVGLAVGGSVGALLAADLAGVGLSGVAQSANVVGAALFAVPAAHIVERRGRRPSLAAGYALAAVGALLVAAAAMRNSVALLFAGLFLQSGSYFQPRFDSQESGFARYQRITRFVAQVLRAPDGPAVPATLTCGVVEENLANNRDMAATLRRQGYEVTFVENRDAHNWIGWRDTLDPHLTTLLQRVWP